MSDISIPGVTNKYNTTQMIEEIMKLERIPVDRLEKDLELYEFQRQTWRDLNVRMSRVRDAARSLYGFQNPFNNRVASSSDEFYLTASATREARESVTEIEVASVATADRLLSSSLNEDFRVPEGDYGFQIGDEEISLRFRGGSLSSFADAINRRSRGLMKASAIRNSADTIVFSLESTRTGEANRLFFEKTTEALALEMGLLKESESSAFNYKPEPEDLRAWEAPLDNRLLRATDEGLAILPGAEGRLPLPLAREDKANMVLEFNVSVKTLPKDSLAVPEAPPGPAIPLSGSISFENLTINSAPSVVDLPNLTPPPPPPTVVDSDTFFLRSGGAVRGLESLPSDDSSRTYRILLKNIPGDLESLNFRNRNTLREVTLSDVKVYNPDLRGEYVAANPITLAGDANLTIDGIPVTRDSNSIDDLIPGVTLNLKRPTREALELSVGPDREAVKDEIITFVGYYNNLLAEVNILSGTDPALVDQLDYYTDDEKDKAREKLGLYQGDSTLRQLKNRLQQIMMNPYESEANLDLRLLSQLGISTNSRPGGGVSAGQLRGYLEIDEGALDNSLENNFQAVKELFGFDSNGDLIVDTGAAYTLDEYLRSYVETGGILSYKVSTLDSRITRTKGNIDDYNVRLEDKEAQLRRQYGTMEGALESMQRQSRALDNFSNTNQQGR